MKDSSGRMCVILVTPHGGEEAKGKHKCGIPEEIGRERHHAEGGEKDNGVVELGRLGLIPSVRTIGMT